MLSWSESRRNLFVIEGFWSALSIETVRHSRDARSLRKISINSTCHLRNKPGFVWHKLKCAMEDNNFKVVISGNDSTFTN